MAKSKVVDIIQALIKTGGVGLENTVNDIVNIYTSDKLPDEVVQDLAFMVRACVDSNGKEIYDQVDGIIDLIKKNVVNTSSNIYTKPAVWCKEPKIWYKPSVKSEEEFKREYLGHWIYPAIPAPFSPKNLHDIPKLTHYSKEGLATSSNIIEPKDQYFPDSGGFYPPYKRCYGRVVDNGWSVMFGGSAYYRVDHTDTMFHLIKKELENSRLNEIQKIIAKLLEDININYNHFSLYISGAEVLTSKSGKSCFRSSLLGYIDFIKSNYYKSNRFFIIHPSMMVRIQMDLSDNIYLWGDLCIISTYIPENTIYTLMNLERDSIHFIEKSAYSISGCEEPYIKKLNLTTDLKILVKTRDFEVLKFVYED